MEFRPLHSEFGADVIDFDVQRAATMQQIEELRRAYDRYSMLLFRGCGRLPPARQVEIAGWFGPPAPIANDGKGSLTSVLQNEELAGRMKLPFHSDLTYTEVPIKAICLNALEVPPGGSSTVFVSSAAAWARLPRSLQGELADKTLRHVYVSRMTEIALPRFVAEHPVRFLHPRTGRPILLVTENHADRILELNEARSREVLAELFVHLYAPAARYQHWWEPGDLLMWDNLMLQHSRPEEASPARGPRVLQRVALAEVGFRELTERARTAAGAS